MSRKKDARNGDSPGAKNGTKDSDKDSNRENSKGEEDNILNFPKFEHLDGGKQEGADLSREWSFGSGEEAATDSMQTSLGRKIFRLASMGFPPEEIEILYGDALLQEGWDGDRLDEVITQGRAWGRAKVMEAQFSAALKGKVSAQAQMLSRLDEWEWEEGEEEELGAAQEIKFVRKVETERAEMPEEEFAEKEAEMAEKDFEDGQGE